LATRNSHKVIELQSLLSHLPIEIRSATELSPQINWVESGSTFTDNARIKVSELKKYTTCAVLADDSGLMVDALNGAPGVYSSRFAGEEGNDQKNIDKLLVELKDMPIERRGAKFVCVLVYVDENGMEHSFEGEVRGSIATKKKGKFGFGYDPVFLLNGGERTMAELTEIEKNTISHRFCATQKFIDFLECVGVV
jgi:XTP/dITP diphosphohydrolase